MPKRDTAQKNKIMGDSIPSCLDFDNVYVVPDKPSDKPITAQSGSGLTHKGFFSPGCSRKFPTNKE